MEQARFIHNERGASAVEFALVLPLLLILLFGIIEFSIILYDKAMITNASREGARAGIIVGLDGTERLSAITTAATDQVNSTPSSPDSPTKLLLFSFNPGDIFTVTSTPSSAADLGSLAFGDNLTVRTTYHYHFLLVPALIEKLAGLQDSGLELSAETTMKVE